jgi:hypothetical protein
MAAHLNRASKLSRWGKVAGKEEDAFIETHPRALLAATLASVARTLRNWKAAAWERTKTDNSEAEIRKLSTGPLAPLISAYFVPCSDPMVVARVIGRTGLLEEVRAFRPELYSELMLLIAAKLDQDPMAVHRIEHRTADNDELCFEVVSSADVYWLRCGRFRDIGYFLTLDRAVQAAAELVESFT